MRILVVQESDWVEKGPHQQHHLMERLQKRGHDVRVIDYEVEWRKKPKHSLLSKRESISFAKTSKDAPIEVIRPSIVKIPILDYISIPLTHGAEIYKQIGDFRPNVTVGFGILNTYVAMRISKKYNVPFVYYLIDSLNTLMPQKRLRPLGRFLERKTLCHSDLVFVINKRLKEYVVEMGADPARVLVLGAGIDSRRFNPRVDGGEIRRKLGIHEDEIVLFFMGWLYAFSGIKEVAYSLMEHKGKPKIKLLVVGRGDLYEELLDLKKNKLDSKLILVDWQPYEKVPRYVAAADVCLLPAYNNEIMRNIVPIKMYEYIACGKPIVATRLPGIVKEFGENNNVAYVDRPEDVLAKAIQFSRDMEALRKMRLKASEYASEHSWETITDQFENILEQLSKQ